MGPNRIEFVVMAMPSGRQRTLITFGVLFALVAMPPWLGGLAIWLVALRYLPWISLLACKVSDLRSVQRDLETAAEAHADALLERAARIGLLEVELNNLRASVRLAADTTGDPVYRRVGLSPSAPDWLVQAARTAYRRRLHPDVHPPHHRSQAHDRYIRAEEAFERIRGLRA